MNSIKAIITGVIFTIVTILLMQLVYLIVAVGYNGIAKDYPFLNDIASVFRYLIAIPVLVIIMFAGGYLSGIIANTKEIFHAFLVGVITVTLMMWTALQNADLTITGIVIIILMLLATTMGGLYAKKKHTPPLLQGASSCKSGGHSAGNKKNQNGK